MVSRLASSVSDADPAQQSGCREVLSQIAQGTLLSLQGPIPSLAVMNPDEVAAYLCLLGIRRLSTRHLFSHLQAAGCTCSSLSRLMEKAAIGAYVDPRDDFSFRLRMMERRDPSQVRVIDGAFRVSWVPFLKGTTRSLDFLPEELQDKAADTLCDVAHRMKGLRYEGCSFEEAEAAGLFL